MHDCCSSSNSTPKNKCKCPVNGLEYTEVSAQTIIHHIKNPWLWSEKNQRYYFCEDPTCPVVYFGEDGSVLTTQDMKSSVGIKDDSPQSLVCYCFGISRSEALSNPETKKFVIEKTKNGLCSCKTSNPSGRCCLKDFPRNVSL